MPVTPFHLGPALLVKAAAPRRFSLGAFAIVQGVIDVESVGNILLGRWPVHATLHTLAGAACVAVAVALGGKPLLGLAYRSLRGRLGHPWWRAQLSAPSHGEVALGALLGAIGHVLPDAMMHDDLEPFAPWAPGNPFLIEGAFVSIHIACVLIGIAGWVGWRRRA